MWNISCDYKDFFPRCYILSNDDGRQEFKYNFHVNKCIGYCENIVKEYEAGNTEIKVYIIYYYY